MMKKQTVGLVIAAALFAGSQAQAQFTYASDDLLLNFRDVSATTDPDVTVDVGNVTTFVNTITALPGGTAVLDTVTGVTPTSGYTATFSGDAIMGTSGLYGQAASGNIVGLTAVAGFPGVSGTHILWLTRQITAPDPTGSSSTPSSQQANTGFQASTANIIRTVGTNAGISGTRLANSSANAVTVASGNASSFQTKAQASGNPGLINFNGNQPVQGNQASLELQQDGSGAFYSALWEVPPTGSGSDTYEGYFTFQPSGEVDFTAAASVPEPSTYALLGLSAFAGFAFRRKIRALVA